jgi:hypothetical protein
MDVENVESWERSVGGLNTLNASTMATDVENVECTMARCFGMVVTKGCIRHTRPARIAKVGNTIIAHAMCAFEGSEMIEDENGYGTTASRTSDKVRADLDAIRGCGMDWETYEDTYLDMLWSVVIASNTCSIQLDDSFCGYPLDDDGACPTHG